MSVRGASRSAMVRLAYLAEPRRPPQTKWGARLVTTGWLRRSLVASGRATLRPGPTSATKCQQEHARPPLARVALRKASRARRSLEAALARESRIATALREVGLALGTTLDLDQLLELILSKLTDALEADRATLYLLDEANDELVSRIVHGREVQSIRMKVGHGIAAGHVAKSGKSPPREGPVQGQLGSAPSGTCSPGTGRTRSSRRP